MDPQTIKWSILNHISLTVKNFVKRCIYPEINKIGIDNAIISHKY